jgi:hypothetical protein
MVAYRTMAAVAVALLGAAAADAQPVAPSPTATPAQQSAKAVSNIGPFAEWPADAFDGPNAPFVICVIGVDPFGAALDRRVADQKISGRVVVVRRFDKAEKGLACHMAFLSGGPTQSVADGLAAFKGAPVLTVTDETRGGSTRGIIHMVTQEDRKRFYVDDQQAAQGHITLSSKLLSLAIAVRPRG